MKITDEKLPIDQLAQLNSDDSISMFAILPIAVIVVLVVVGTALYFFRRGKNWNDLGEAMRSDDRDPETGAAQPSSFGTRELERIPPPVPGEDD